jgi:hypothetical protein
MYVPQAKPETAGERFDRLGFYALATRRAMHLCVTLDEGDVRQELAACAWRCMLRHMDHEDVQLFRLVSHALKQKTIDLWRKMRREPSTQPWCDDPEPESEGPDEER